MSSLVSFPLAQSISLKRRRTDLPFSEKAIAELDKLTKTYREGVADLSRNLAAGLDSVSETHVRAARDLVEDRARKRRQVFRRLLTVIGGIVSGSGLSPILNHVAQGGAAPVQFGIPHLIVILIGIVLILEGEAK